MKWIVLVLTGIILYQCNKTETTSAKTNLANNMTVEVSKFYKLRDYIRVAGKIVNNNSVPAGAHVKITCYDAKGGVVTVKDFWPESTNNINSKSTSAFAYMFEYIGGIKRYEAEVVEARTW